MYEEYRELARRVAIPLSTDPDLTTFVFSLEGNYDGHPVRLERICGSGARVLTSSPIVPALDLGLGLRKAGLFTSLRSFLGAEEIEVGDAAFDAAWAIRGDEPERVRALLSPPVREAIRTCVFSDLTISDERFAADISTYEETVDDLERSLREATSVARIVEAAAVHVPPARALRAHHEAWVAFARPYGLPVGSTPLSMSGRVGRVDLFARSVRKRPDQFSFEISVGAEPSLESPLLIRSRESERIAGLGIAVGAATAADFERVFEVHGAASSATFGDPELRRRLVELAAFGAVFFNRRGVSVHANAVDLAPGQFGGLVESMRSLVELRFAGQQAGYR